MSSIVFISLGGNLGNTLEIFKNSYLEIEKKIGRITAFSNLYQTAAWGKTDQPDFLNQVIIVQSDFSAANTMETILTIEENMGRVRTQKNAPREIDIDILFFNNDIINLPELIIPHPLLQERKFVLIPLNEIAPDFKHPILLKTSQELLKICPDSLNVQKKEHI
jgi:2-amino-4-hydroxy-6-hydroxymethyldihydropteridine diphosphokinase